MNYNPSTRDSRDNIRKIQCQGSGSKGYSKKRSYSRAAKGSSPLASSHENAQNEDIRKTAEFLLNLSLLVFETQDYAGSAVAAGCILASRHINHQNPVWNEDLTNKTGYSISKVAKIANILLKNYNVLQIGGSTVPSEQAFYPQPVKFNGELI